MKRAGPQPCSHATLKILSAGFLEMQRFRVLSVNCIFIGGGLGGGWEAVPEIRKG